MFTSAKELVQYNILKATGARTEERMEGERCTLRLEIDAAGNETARVENPPESEAKRELVAIEKAHEENSARDKEIKKRKGRRLAADAPKVLAAAGTAVLVAAALGDDIAAVARKAAVKKAVGAYARAMYALESLAAAAESKGQGRKQLLPPPPPPSGAVEKNAAAGGQETATEPPAKPEEVRLRVIMAAAALNTAAMAVAVAGAKCDDIAAVKLVAVVDEAVAAYADAVVALESLAPSAESKGRGRKRARTRSAKGRAGEEDDEAEEQDLMV